MNRTPSVLVVDDEPSVRMLMADVVRMNGYATRMAKHGCEALEMCGQAPGPPDLLITDLIMPPYFDGVELTRRLHALKPDMKALYVSAFAADALISQAVTDRQADFLPKPFSPIILAQMVNGLLGGNGNPDREKGTRGRLRTVLLTVSDTTRRQWIKERLRGSGISVLDAPNLAEARFLAQWHEGPIQLLLTDIPMGKWSRGNPWKRLKDFHPGLEILVMAEGREGWQWEAKQSDRRDSRLGGMVRHIIDPSRIVDNAMN